MSRTQLTVVYNFIPCTPGDIWLSVLPVWHSFERIIQYFILTLKTSVAYSKPVAQIMLSDMAQIKPGWMCGVPRLWEGLANGINKAMIKKGGIALELFELMIAEIVCIALSTSSFVGSRRRMLFCCEIPPISDIVFWNEIASLPAYKRR